MELVTSSDSSTWVPEGDGFGYPPKRFKDPNYPHTNEEEEQKEEHPHDKNGGDATAEDSDSANGSMPREEAPIPNKMKFKLGPYCPICTPAGYRCMKNQTGTAWCDLSSSVASTNKTVMVPTPTRDSEDDTPRNSKDDTPGRIHT